MQNFIKTADAPAIPFRKLVGSQNIAELLTEEQCVEIGSKVVDDYSQDCDSRKIWEQRNQDAFKLALQVKEQKNFPWENCSNVKFPLMTIASLQFLARISLMTKGRVLAKVSPVGPDPQGKRAAQADRISNHITLQINDEDESWHDFDEQVKLSACIIGAGFKKTYFDSIDGLVRSEHIPASDLVLDYYTRDFDSAYRVTHLIYMRHNAVHERVRQGLFLEMQDSDPSIETNIIQQTMDSAQGRTRPSEGDSGEDNVYPILEQHTWLDLDGDGYAEPYILSVRQDTGQLLRIVARYFDNGDVHRVQDPAVRQIEGQIKELETQAKGLEGYAAHQVMSMISSLEKQITSILKDPKNHIIRITPQNHFTRYLFIPSPDGGVYGLGFGSLLGPMNESVNTLVNQLIDSGTMSTTAGGFLGRGVKLKGGRNSFDPFEWKPIDSAGDDLRKNIFPLPVREPSEVLFRLLETLVVYSEKISGSTDIMTGVTPGQNTPAETSRNTLAQGMMLFSGIYNRMYRAFRAELKTYVSLNRLFLEQSSRYISLCKSPYAILSPDDYNDVSDFRILPAASPDAITAEQLKEKAFNLLQVSNSIPGFNRYEVTRMWLEASGFDNIDKIFPNPQGPNALPPPQDPKIELKKAELQQSAKEHQDEMQLEIASLQSEASVNAAKITELQAKAQLHISQAKGVATGHQIAIIEAQIGAAKNRQEGLLKALDIMQRSLQSAAKEKGNVNGTQPTTQSSRSEGMGAPSGNEMVS